MFKNQENRAQKPSLSKNLQKNSRVPLHHNPTIPQTKLFFPPNIENKVKNLQKAISPHKQKLQTTSSNDPSSFKLQKNLPEDATEEATTNEEQQQFITTTTFTTTMTTHITMKPHQQPQKSLTKSNNSSTKTLPIKPQQQQITPNSSNKSLLNQVKKPINPPVSQSRSIGGTPDTFKHRKKVKDYELPNHEPTKFSFKKNGVVKAYAVNTNQGIVRNYNEDRVSIILNIMKPIDRQNEYWPRCSFFGVYDGHGGVACADFLRDNLHQYVISNPNFPWNPKKALEGGFLEAEKNFLALAYKINENNQVEIMEKSGSCALVILIIGDMCYIANVGDSRAIMSGESGQKIWSLSRDHKPMDELEYKRISDAGGKIYQTKIQAYCNSTQGGVGTVPDNGYLVGPYRVLPGRLSVTRTFGDIEAKMEEMGGNPNVVIATPEIKCVQITEDHDFIILASDGIYDKLTNPDVINSVWGCIQEAKGDNIHQACANAVEIIMKTAISKRTLDNITVVMIAFSSFKYLLFPKRPDLIGNNSVDNIVDYSKLQEISRINNSFDVGCNDFSLDSTQKNDAEVRTPLQNTQKQNKIVRKKTSNGSIGGNNNCMPNSDQNKTEKSQEKNKPFSHLNANKNLNGYGFNFKLPSKKMENNLYSHRTVHKNNLEKKK